MNRKKISGKILPVTILGILTLVWIVPVAWAVLTSFKTETEIKTLETLATIVEEEEGEAFHRDYFDFVVGC